ncbi:MAG: threonylcarbamoyl-AMP synthase [Alphaproteobacteria bacterium]|nr:threonylcarbamoyl-AMP synthase [Alphaproteobacteria bacterium]
MTARIVAPTPEAIAEAARLLCAGRLVAFPTETVYGLGADATSDAAVAAIYRAKGRPAHNPLIVHVAAQADAEALAVWSEPARRLARTFWPGALTLVLPLRPGAPIASAAVAGLDTIALRVPDHPVALDLLRAAGRPLAAPSANPSGRVSPTRAEHVAAGLGDAVDLILDGGPCRVGIESTVVALGRDIPQLLRPGGVPATQLEDVLNQSLLPATAGARSDGRPRAPGQLESHYAPRAAVRLNATSAAPSEGGLAFGARDVPGGRRTINLSARGDVAEAAANLYAALRALDEANVSAIAVAPIPEEGLGVAINDRLRRASARRPS